MSLTNRLPSRQATKEVAVDQKAKPSKSAQVDGDITKQRQGEAFILESRGREDW